MNKAELRDSPRWNAVYGSLVAMYIQAHAKEHGRLPNDHDLQIIVRMSRGHADEVEEKWQEMVAMEQKVGWGG